eukprot:248635-Ditylum_brightwellii.AAC.1
MASAAICVAWRAMNGMGAVVVVVVYIYINKHSASDEKAFVAKFIDRVHPLQGKGFRIQQIHNQWIWHFCIHDEPGTDKHVDMIALWHHE